MTKKILLIEDNEFILDMYQIKFEQEGYKVFIAENGIDGLEVAKKEKPDLILLDLVMPKIDGYQVLSALKGDPTTKDIKVFVLSNLVQENEINKSFSSGADGYLVKASMTPQQLVDNIKKIFAGIPIGAQKTLGNGNLTNGNGKIKSQVEPAKTEATKVLIIEDETAIIEMYKLYLENDGYAVDTAQNGAWGLKLAQENKYDVILLDMIMPAMNGNDALRKLKEGGASKDTPIIVLSNSGQDEDIDMAIKNGAKCYLIKSLITPAKITQEIRKAISKN